MNKLSVGAFIFLGAFSALTSSVSAASLYVDPAFSTLSRGDAVTFSVRLDTDEATGECVNAVDAVITYSENITPVDVSLGDSIFNVWVEPPTINQTDRTITFAGGIPNGYCGRVAGDPRLTNTLVKLIFRSPGFSIGSADDTNVATLTFQPETTAYLNDGFGTKANLQTFGAQVELFKTAGSELQDSWRENLGEDEIPPEAFGITLLRDQSAFDNKYFIVFNTTDKQTGIDQFQVIEEPVSTVDLFAWGAANAPWETSRSPHVLSDQTLNSVIRVKAIDKAGNEYIATLIPDESQRSISLSKLVIYGLGGVITLLFIAIAFVGIKSFIRRRRAKRAVDSILDSEDNT
jgi:hypothetical protein